jgi:hypothetical protein
MSHKRVLQAVTPQSEQRTGALDAADQIEESFGPFLNAESAARFLDFSDCKEPVEAFRAWAKRKGIVAGHRGTKLVYAKADLVRAVFGTRKAS